MAHITMATTITTSKNTSGGDGGSGATASASATNAVVKKKLKVDTNIAINDDDDNTNDNNEELLESTLFRLTRGLPRRELQLIVSEADECETLLQKDIELLEKALLSADGSSSEQDDETTLNTTVIDSLLTPLDRYWTASALVGRLNGPLALPPIPTLQEAVPEIAANNNPKLSPKVDETKTLQLSKDLVELQQHPRYTMQHDTPQNLLALHKKILAHRSSLVFKRPVKPEEAPGYTDRVFFPMDLSLVRKLIVSKQITSYQQFHQYIGLISHNCVLFNGRESDYGLVAREFEMAADEAIRHAVSGIPSSRKTPTPRPPSTTPAVSATTTTTTGPTTGTAGATVPSENTTATATATTKKKS